MSALSNIIPGIHYWCRVSGCWVVGWSGGLVLGAVMALVLSLFWPGSGTVLVPVLAPALP